MRVVETTNLKKHRAVTKRIRVSQGGTSSSKTISILWLLLDYAVSNPNKLISICGVNHPHLKRGALRDLKNILAGHNFYEYYGIKHNKADSTFTFWNGTVIEFIALNELTARGGRRDVLYINECNLIAFETYEQLEVRTKEFIWLDYNPSSEFWVHEHVIGGDDVDFLQTNYMGNEALDEVLFNSIEKRKHNLNWYKVYGLGELGEVEGLVYSGWECLDSDDIPTDAELIGYGLDFGFTNSPTAIVAVYRYEDGFILDEVCYETGLFNSKIASIIKNAGIDGVLGIADSASPKDIAELQELGITIKGVTKTSHDKNMTWKRWLVEKVGEMKISYTPRSINLRKEYLSYMWATDRTGKKLNVPIDFNDHLMDAAGYRLVENIQPQIEYGGIR